VVTFHRDRTKGSIKWFVGYPQKKEREKGPKINHTTIICDGRNSATRTLREGAKRLSLVCDGKGV